MTIVLPALRERVSWAPVEDGFHVGSRSGEFVGYAEQTPDGHFVGFDGRSTPVGRYETLDEARRAVEEVPENAAPVMSPRAASAFHAAASISGVVAIGTLAVAVMTLPGL
jgi:hypothetical protein